MKQKQAGFTVVEIALGVAAILLIGLVSWKAYDNYRVANSRNQSTVKQGQEANSKKVSSLPTATPTASPAQSSPADTPAPNTATATPKPVTATATPKPTATPTPPVWQIVRPDSSNCPAWSQKTVYSTATSGAPIYNYSNENVGTIVGYLPYKAAQAGTCFYVDKGWIQYGGTSYPDARYLRFQDVSIVGP